MKKVEKMKLFQEEEYKKYPNLKKRIKGTNKFLRVWIMFIVINGIHMFIGKNYLYKTGKLLLTISLMLTLLQFILVGTLIVVGIVWLFYMTVTIQSISRHIDYLDKQYKYVKGKGYTKIENKGKERRETQKYLLRVNKLFEERNNQVNVQIENNKGVLTKRDVQTVTDYLEQMDEQIQEIKRVASGDSSLLWELTKEDGLETVEEFYKDLIKEPNRIVEVPNVLHRYIPDMCLLAKKYYVVSKHKVIKTSTENVQKDTISTIEKLVQLVKKEYKVFKSKDIKELQHRLKYIENNIIK